MVKRTKVVLPRRWQRFPSAYAKNLDYWYFPKGLAATSESIRPRLEALRPLRWMPWREAQVEYIKRLNEAGVTHAETEWEGGGAPLGRMLLQVLRLVGFAWINPADRVEITDAGEEFLKTGSDPEHVLSTQLDRYQLWNPSIKKMAHRAVKVHPIPFLAEVLRTISPQSISAHEYQLFVARTRSYDDVDQVVEQIEEYRSLSPDEQRALYDQCNAYRIGGKGRRTSLLNTVGLNHTYAFAALTLSKLLERDGNGGLKPRSGALRTYRPFLQRYEAAHAFIEFKNQKDWFAYFGNPKALPTVETALEYYIGKGDVESAVAVKKRQGVSKTELKEFREMVVAESQVRDYLAENLDEIAQPTGYNLVLIGKEYSTGVSDIDLLCRDKPSGDYVVVELKKGRSADRVYGQCSRYMGWIRKNLAEPNDVKVHGIIVARKIDEKLKAARDAHDTKVALVEFSMRFSAKAV